MGADGVEVSETTGWAINRSGAVAGYAVKVTDGANLGKRPVRWEAGEHTAHELGVLGTLMDGRTDGQAYGINAAGTVVGSVTKYVGEVDWGQAAIRWSAGATTPTELGGLGTFPNRAGYSIARAINDAGVAVGTAVDWGAGTEGVDRAVRWDAGGTIATELGTLGKNLAGDGNANAYGINNAGVIVGNANRFEGNTYLGTRPVRWDAGGTTATELDGLGPYVSDARIDPGACAVNAAGGCRRNSHSGVERHLPRLQCGSMGRGRHGSYRASEALQLDVAERLVRKQRPWDRYCG
jgi:hypothetical protein